MHRTYLGVLERGDGNPTVDTLEKVAHALGVSVSEIIRGDAGNAETGDGPMTG